MSRPLPYLLAVMAGFFGTGPQVAAEEQMYSQYDPGPAFQFGRANPDAPPEIEDFDFLVGSFECGSELFMQGQGRFVQLKTRWMGEYALNGWAIHDRTWNSVLAAMSVRIFNVDTGQWEVTFFMQPYYQSGVWRGGLVNDDMVLERTMEDEEGAFTSRLTFFEISDSGFRWISEHVRNGKVFHTTWKIDCKRE